MSNETHNEIVENMFKKLHSYEGKRIVLTHIEDDKVYREMGILDLVIDYQYLVMSGSSYPFIGNTSAIKSIVGDTDTLYENPFIGDKFLCTTTEEREAEREKMYGAALMTASNEIVKNYQNEDTKCPKLR